VIATGSPCTPTPANLSSCYFGGLVSGPGGGVLPIVSRVNDNYGYVNEGLPAGHSSYNSLQVNLVRHAARGVTMQASYTYSHCIPEGENAQLAQNN
jgi:hypothetical protein